MSWFGTGASQYRLPVVTLKLGMKMYEVFFGGRGGYMKMIMKQQPGRCSSMQSRSSTSNRFSAQPLLLELKDPKISRPRTSNHRGTSFCEISFTSSQSGPPTSVLSGCSNWLYNAKLKRFLSCSSLILDILGASLMGAPLKNNKKTA